MKLKNIVENAAKAAGLSADALIAENTSIGSTIAWMKEEKFAKVFPEGESEFAFTGRSSIQSFTNDKGEEVTYPVVQLKGKKGNFKVSLYTLTSHLQLDGETELKKVKISASLTDEVNEEWDTHKVAISSIETL